MLFVKNLKTNWGIPNTILAILGTLSLIAAFIQKLRLDTFCKVVFAILGIFSILFSIVETNIPEN